LDDTIKSGDEAYELTGAIVLGNIPQIQLGDEVSDQKPAKPLQALVKRITSLVPAIGRISSGDDATKEAAYVYCSVNPRSAVAEEFRSLRINLDFVGVDKPLKTILITSSEPREGKTSIASNLAIVMAQAGKKVILVDADFRKPSVNEHFRIENTKGLSDVFRDNLDLYGVGQQWKENGLWIITTGKMPPNPIDLLSSHKMDQVLAELETISDVVIIDGPPLMFPDSVALSRKVDGVLMVLKHAISRKGPTQVSSRQLNQVGARVVGVVMNGVPGKRTHYYHSYYRSANKVKSEPKQIN
jgi:capsular exopolysaccharide synthesis family protein